MGEREQEKCAANQTIQESGSDRAAKHLLVSSLKPVHDSQLIYPT